MFVLLIKLKIISNLKAKSKNTKNYCINYQKNNNSIPNNTFSFILLKLIISYIFAFESIFWIFNCFMIILSKLILQSKVY